MQNPWLKLEDDFVLPQDKEILNRFPDVKTEGLIPFPFFGDPNKATAFLLLSNPRYSDENPEEHSRRNFVEAARRNLRHEILHPYLDSNTEFMRTAGSRWWHRVLKHVFVEFGPDEHDQIASQLMCIQLFPYHSKKFADKPALRKSVHTLSSYQYSCYLVQKAIRDEKQIIVMRAPWRDLLQSEQFGADLPGSLLDYSFITVLDFKKIKAGAPVISYETMGNKKFNQLITKLKQS